MPPKRPLLVSPEQADAGEVSGEVRSPRKRLRRTVLVIMWLERRRVRGLTIEQVARLIRLVQEELAKVIILLGLLLVRVDIIERLFLERFDTIQRLFLEPFAASQRLILERFDTIQRTIEETRRNQREQIELTAELTVCRVLQELRAASPTNRVHPHTRPPHHAVETAAERLTATEDETKTVQLRFLSSPKQPLYTTARITSENEKPVKIGIFENGKIITSGVLSSVKVEILAIHGDFSVGDQENFSQEEFDRQIVRARDGQGSMLRGDRVLMLENGEASLDDVSFKESSCRTNTRKVKLAVRVLPGVPLPFRVQIGTTDPLTVKDRRSESNEKHHPPLLEDPVFHLDKIAREGTYHGKLQSNNILTVQDLLKFYFKNESGLRDLIGMKNSSWSAMIKHAKDCDPGNLLYSHCITDKNVVLFFNSVYNLVGAKFDDSYIAYSNLSPSQQHKVNEWKKHAYDKLDGAKPDYIMINNLPEPLCPNNGAGPSMPATSTPQQHSHHQTTQEEVGQQQPSSGHDEFCYDMSQRNIGHGQGLAGTPPYASAQEFVQLTNDGGRTFPGTSASQNSQLHPSDYLATYPIDHESAAQEDILGRLSPIAGGSYGDYLYECINPAQAVPMAFPVPGNSGTPGLPIHGPQPANHEELGIQINLDGLLDIDYAMFNDAFPSQQNDDSS